MRKNVFNIYTFLLIAGIAVMVAACEKVVHGYLSDQIFYQVNPFDVQQGQTVVSASLITNGSTQPLHVQMLALKDENGKNVDTAFTNPQLIKTFTSTVTYLDSTLDLLNAKLKDSLVAPFSIAEIGGRLQFTSATKYLTGGTYHLDISVSNVRDTKVLTDACTINIGDNAAYVNYGGEYTGTFDPLTGGYIADAGAPVITVDFTPGDAGKIIYKFVDKNDNVYNPKANGLTLRTNRWTMKNFDPYYPEVVTDNSIEYQFPEVPNQFPVFENPGINGVIPRGNYGVFPAIPASHTDLGSPVFVFMDLAFYKRGTYVVTTKFTGVAWK